MDACAAPAIPDISGAREFNLAALQKKLGKRPACDVRDASEPFHHDCKKHKGRVGQPLRIRGRRVKFLYPFPPTEDDQVQLLKMSAIACTCCLPEEMQRGECHASWLLHVLRKKFKWNYGPKLVSAAIPPELIAQGKREGKNAEWKRAREIHRHAFVSCKACHVSHIRAGVNVPSLLEGVVIGVSRFGNPFHEMPLKQSKALFVRYVQNNFAPLSEQEVMAIVDEVDPVLTGGTPGPGPGPGPATGARDVKWSEVG